MKTTTTKKSAIKKKVAKPKEPKKEEKKTFYCSLHGKNLTHNLDKCFALIKRKQQKDNKPFSPKKLQKELHSISCKKGKQAAKDIDNYMVVLKKEKKKLEHTGTKKKCKAIIVDSSDCSSANESNESMHQMQHQQRLTKKAKQVGKSEVESITKRLDSLGKLKDTDESDNS